MKELECNNYSWGRDFYVYFYYNKTVNFLLLVDAMHANATIVIVPFYGTLLSLKISPCCVPHVVEYTS